MPPSAPDAPPPAPAPVASPAARPRTWGYLLFQTGLGMVVFQGVTFLSGILLARGLGAEGMGRFQLLISLTVFTVTFAKMGLDEGLAYLIPRYQRERPARLRALLLYALAVPALLSLLLGALYAAGAGFIEAHIFTLPGFASDLRFALWLLPAFVLLSLGAAALRGLGRSDLRAFAYYYLVGISFFVLLAAFYFWGPGLDLTRAYLARILSFALGSTVAVLMVARLAPRGGGLALSRSELRPLHAFSGLLVFVALFEYAVEQPLIDLAILARVASPETVGIYSVAFRVASLVGLATAAITLVTGPALAGLREEKEKLAAQYRRASAWLARITVFAGFGLLLVREEVLRIFGAEYAAGGALLAVLILGRIAVGLQGANTALLIACGRARLEFLLTGACVLLLLASGIWLGMLFGAVGVALATAGSSFALALARRLACRRVLGIAAPNTLLPLLTGVAALAAGLALRALLPAGLAPALAAAAFALTFAVGDRLLARYRTSFHSSQQR